MDRFELCPSFGICGEAVHIVVRYRSRPLPDGRIIQSGFTGEYIGQLLS